MSLQHRLKSNLTNYTVMMIINNIISKHEGTFIKLFRGIFALF